MSYDTNIPASFPDQIATNWDLLTQQTQSVLERTVTLAPHTGNTKQIKFGQTFSTKAHTGRAEKTTPKEYLGSTRWQQTVFRDIADPIFIDQWDATSLAEVALPNSAAIQGFDAAYQRDKDDEIIASLTRAVYTGDHSPTTAVSFPTSTNSIAHGSTGLTVAKIASVKRLMRLNNVDIDREELYGVITPYDEEFLLSDVAEIRSIDYSKVQPIEDGSVAGKRWMGINWVISNRLPTDTSAHTATNYFYTKKSILWNPGKRMVNVDILPEHSHCTQITATWMFGATRREDAGVFSMSNLYTSKIV